MRMLRVSVVLAGIAAVLLVAGATGSRSPLPVVNAQEASGGVITAQTGIATSTNAPGVVDMDYAPAFTNPAQLPPKSVRPPWAGVPAEVYRARKEKVAAMGSLAGAMGLDLSPAPEFRDDSLTGAANEAGMLTPGATPSYDGLNLNQCGYIPSDHAMAVGSTYLLQALNGCVAVYAKTTGVIQAGFPKTLNAFFGASGSGLFDPRAYYDVTRSRFVVIAEQYNNSTGLGTLWVAVSQSSNALGAWWTYALAVPTAVAGDFPDFPTLGGDKDVLIVGFNVFKAGGGLSNVQMFLPKAKMYSGLALGTWWYVFNWGLDGQVLDTIQPANVSAFSSDYPRAAFMVASRNINYGGGQCINGCNGLVVMAISNALWVAGTPGIQYTASYVPTANNYYLPPNALQPGCTSPTSSCAIDTLDTRITGQVTYANGTLWASLNTKRSGNNTATAIWYQLRPYLNDGNAGCIGSYAGKCAQMAGVDILNEDCYICGGRVNSASEWNAVPVSDMEGNATMVLSYSSLNDYPGVIYVSRRVTQAKNNMHDGGIWLAAGQAFYQRLDSYGRNRWGDYSAAQVDTSNYFWFGAQYSKAGNIWGTRIGRNKFTLRTQF